MQKNNHSLFTKKLQVLFVGLVASAMLAIVHTVGTERYLYWVFDWFDIVTHAIGGIAIGALLSALYIKKRQFILPILILVLVGWEIFETWAKQIPTGQAGYSIDTTIDLFVGGSAALLVIFLCNRYLRH